MIAHCSLGILPFTQIRQLKILINRGEAKFAGNLKFKIFGTLKCNSGKRLNLENRVFFQSAKEAIDMGFRPCGNCLKNKYAL